MPEENNAPDLLDLKFLPAWVKEGPNENPYANFAGEDPREGGTRERRGPDRRGGDRPQRGPRPPRGKDKRDSRDRRPAPSRAPEARREEAPAPPAPAVEVRFLPDARVLEAVLAQMKSGHLAYSVFSLARMFLDKPERYDVHLKAETATLFQLGENGPVASDRRLLENGAFLSEKDQFYRTEVTQSEPIKGNFTAVARCRLSGVLLGPTNHHAYQPQLRNLYEQRFSRRMSFPEYQRQVEIVSDPEAVERWKEEARSVTSYVTLQEEPPLTFNNAAETERHFRQTYLPAMLRENAESTLDGVVSRRLTERSLGRAIEDAWAQEFRSPSKMMQELIGAFRQAALHIFRHRKGMLFVSPVRAKPFSHAGSSVSASVSAILATLTANPGINRKQLLENLPGAGTEGDAEKKKLSLASDLHWLIGEGHVIEFNDGALDLARNKPPAPAPAARPNGKAAEPSAPNEPAPETGGEAAPAAEAPATGEAPPAPEAPATEEAAPARDEPVVNEASVEEAPAPMVAEEPAPPVAEVPFAPVDQPNDAGAAPPDSETRADG